MEPALHHSTISYPYLPPGRTIEYVGGNDKFMELAREVCLARSTDKNHPTGSVVVRGGDVVGRGANQATLHHSWAVVLHKKLCVRRTLGIKTGEHYWLCPGCASPKSHSEQQAIADAKKHNENTEGSDIYLWGHWWCCEPCWNAITKAGIKNVYLMEGSEHFFNKSDAANIVGKRFEQKI